VRAYAALPSDGEWVRLFQRLARGKNTRSSPRVRRGRQAFSLPSNSTEGMYRSVGGKKSDHLAGRPQTGDATTFSSSREGAIPSFLLVGRSGISFCTRVREWSGRTTFFCPELKRCTVAPLSASPLLSKSRDEHASAPEVGERDDRGLFSFLLRALTAEGSAFEPFSGRSTGKRLVHLPFLFPFSRTAL